MFVINQQTKRNTFNTVLMLNCILFALYGMKHGKNIYGPLAILITSAMLLFSTPEQGFLILIAMIPYGDCWKISGVSVRGLMCLLPLIPMLKYGKLYRNKAMIAVVGILLFFIEAFNDIQNADIFSVFNTIIPFVYLSLLATLDLNTENWDIVRMGFIFVLSTLISEFASLSVGGGFNAYNNNIAYYRFGQESSTTYLAGAMDIPIFSCVSMFFLFSLLSSKRKLMTSQKVCIMSLIIMHFIFGVMTISRVFILGIVVMLIVMLFQRSQYNTPQKIGTALAVITAVFLIGFIFFRDFLGLLFHKLLNRFQSSTVSSGHDGRTYIWISCIRYLLSHPMALLFGKGIISYPQIGRANGLAFSAMAHNFVLDILMGIGLIGAVCLIIMLLAIFRKVHKFNTACWGVAIILFAMFVVSGTLNYICNFIYIILAVIVHNNFSEQLE